MNPIHANLRESSQCIPILSVAVSMDYFYHRSLGFTDFNTFASDARIADHTFLSMALADLVQCDIVLSGCSASAHDSANVFTQPINGVNKIRLAVLHRVINV